MLLKLEGFKNYKTIDLNMGYYHIKLSKDASNLFMIVVSWGNTATRVYQWESETIQIFPTEINKLFQGFEFIRAYIEELLIPEIMIGRIMYKMELALAQLIENRIKCKI